MNMLPVYPLAIYLIWRLIILLYQIFLQPFYIVTADSLTIYQRVFLSWTTYWDAGHYLGIATQGYHYPQQAFFPLWPLLIKIFSFITNSFNNASFILSFIFGLSTFVLFYFLAVRLIGKTNAKLALVLFASFPSTMFLLAGYTEGLFLTLTLLSFLMLEKKLYLLSAVFAGLTTMTRLAGIGIMSAYLFLNKSFGKRVLYISLSLSGLIFYILFLQFTYGNGFLFADAQREWCKSQGRCQFIFPLFSLVGYSRLILMGWVRPNLSVTFLDWFSSVFFLVMLVPVFKKFKFHYFVYSLIVIFLPLFSSTVGMVRYVLVAFPVFFVIPLLLRSKLLFFILCLLLFLLEIRFINSFTNRVWVA